jgi:hypothetical protein
LLFAFGLVAELCREGLVDDFGSDLADDDFLDGVCFTDFWDEEVLFHQRVLVDFLALSTQLEVLFVDLLVEDVLVDA